MSKQFNSNASISRRTFLEGLGVLGVAAASLATLSACSSSSDSGGSSASSSSNDSSSNASTSGSTASSAATSSNASTASANGKVLVAYFSGTGHTRRVAQELATDLGGDIFEIVPANPYSDDDLNFNDDSSRVVREYQNQDQRDTPLAQNAPDNFADYQTVLVGYPIWWGDSAWAMHRFASENDFTGKTVIPFCTSLSSGLGASGTNLAQLAGTGDWQDGQRFSENVDLGDVKSWAAGLQA